MIVISVVKVVDREVYEDFNKHNILDPTLGLYHYVEFIIHSELPSLDKG